MTSRISDTYDWAVIGAGPAGMAAAGKLLDAGITNIVWLDPNFNVGDLGQKWYEVPSNTSVKLFIKFMESCRSFNFNQCPDSEKQPLIDLDPEDKTLLKHVVKPLKWISDHLREKIDSINCTVLSLRRSSFWEIETDGARSIRAQNIVLATGTDPKSLNLPNLEEIKIEHALNPTKLPSKISPGDKIAVFGSSHSAILALANLINISAEINIEVINFYRSPHRYAVYFDDWILFDDTGLKGFAADWARQNLDANLPANLTRVLISSDDYKEKLSLCNKAVYAIGFQKRDLPLAKGCPDLEYDNKTGIIAPGLFGVGIAFPQVHQNRLGHTELRVGLWKFIEYLDIIMPIWLKYAN